MDSHGQLANIYIFQLSLQNYTKNDLTFVNTITFKWKVGF